MSEIWLYLKPPIAIFAVIAPVCIVVVTSVNLLLIARKFAQKDRQSMKWQGIITTVLTSTVFCISFLPMFLFLVLDPFLKTEVKVQKSNLFLLKVAISFLLLNTISNFYIYCMTVSSFRTFVLSRLQMFARLFTSSSFQGKTIAVQFFLVLVLVNHLIGKVALHVMGIMIALRRGSLEYISSLWALKISIIIDTHALLMLSLPGSRMLNDGRFFNRIRDPEEEEAV